MILFDHSGKNKKLYRKLHSFAKIKNYDGSELSADTLADCDLFVCFGSKLHSDSSVSALKEFIDRGGSVAIFSTEAEPNNHFLSFYGIRIEEGTVVRAVYHEGFFHPKHALIQNGIAQQFGSSAENMSTSMAFVHPNGTTLSVEPPSFTLLSSGSTSYPVDCPVAAAWESTVGRGRLIVVGSADIFSDEWLERQDNSKLCDIFFDFLLHRGMEFDPSLGRSDFEEKEIVPDIASLSNLIKPCLQEIEPLPQDYTTLLCDDQFGLTMEHIPKVIDAYKTLNVPYEPLTLIEPHFNCPHPPLRMATHAPTMLAQPSPELELFDLDDCLTDARTRLVRLGGKYVDDCDLTNYILEAGWILGVDGGCNQVDDEEEKAKHVLHAVAKMILMHSNEMR